MCQNCQSLVKAIDAYLQKANSDLSDTLKEEGYVEPDATVDMIEELEEGIEDALTEETDYIVDQAQKSGDLKTFQSNLSKIKAADVVAASIAKITREEFEKYMPQIIKAYIQQTDRSLTLTTISKKTTAWVQSWSEQLGEIMKLNSHKELEKILVSGLESGQGIAEFTRQILESGIRDEYYKARRVALTEVLRAHSVSQQEAFMQSPSVKQKMWRHTGEYRNKPRPNHVKMSGQIVDKAECYTLEGADGETYYPMYPKDIILPPGESVNCHCLSQGIPDEEILGLSLDERKALQQKAIEEMDDEWEKELDAANRERKSGGGS